MLRKEIAALLRSNAALVGALPGGIYPLADTDADYLSRDTYPAAFDDFGEVLPTALVRDSGGFPQGPAPARGSSQVVDILLWQQRGRDAIDAASRVLRVLVTGGMVAPSGLYVYQLRYAGDGPSVRDPGLDDAEHGWQRWQAVVVTKG